MNSPLATPLIAVDIGNSTTKFARYEPDSFVTAAGELPQPSAVARFETNADLPSGFLNALPARVAWRVACVQREAERRLAEFVSKSRPLDAYHRLSRSDLPIGVEVDFPDRVGLDRLAAAVAADFLRPRARAAVVIGAGSAITIDLVAPHGAFVGGTILPGFRMSAQALAAATDLLPLALLDTSAAAPSAIGKNTEAAIRSGLFWGAVGAAREITARFAEIHPEPEVFVTGGDLSRLAPLVNDRVRFIPGMVLAGIAISAIGKK